MTRTDYTRDRIASLDETHQWCSRCGGTGIVAELIKYPPHEWERIGHTPLIGKIVDRECPDCLGAGELTDGPRW